MSFRLILLRHGATDWTQENRYQGSADVPLSAAGEAQAHAAADALAQESVAAVYSSSQCRARATAEIIARQHGLTVAVDDAFREICYGSWEGLCYSEVAERFPDLYRAWKTEPHTVTIPGGEGILSVRERVLTRLREIRLRHEGQTVVLVTHGTPLRLILLEALGLPPARFWSIHTSPGGMSDIDYTPEGAVIRKMNVVSDTVRPLPTERRATDGHSRSAFPSPFDLETPPGADGWEEMYPYYHRFTEARRDQDEGKFWFLDGMYNPAPMYPFDAIMADAWWLAANQYNTRVWVFPRALGIDQRIVNGYLYLGPSAISDPVEVERRAALFRERAGYYYDHWDELDAEWVRRAEACIQELRVVEIRDVPAFVAREVVMAGKGFRSGYDLLEAYNRIIENNTRMAYYHFEMLNLGYAVCHALREFCRCAFPSMADQTVAKMVAGMKMLLLRPDDELRKLAATAVELDLGHILKQPMSPGELDEVLRQTPNGRLWLEALEAAKEPWFWYSTGAGACHAHRAWIDDLTIPLNAIRGYVEKLVRGESIARPLERILAERDRLVAGYRELLPTEDDRRVFDGLLDLAWMVIGFVEDHNFYVEHWHRSVFWNRIREFGAIFRSHGFLLDAEDIFYLNRFEIQEALYDLLIGWATATPPCGPRYWPREVERRKRIMDALRRWPAPPALGQPPESVTDPMVTMLWGVTTETIQNWLATTGTAGAPGSLKGCPASPGVAEGEARVVRSTEDLANVREGEILISPIVAPSWSAVFLYVKGAVSDSGGIMSHAAIVAREYGLPAVVGTGIATQRIKTGQRVRVDGNAGTVSILE